jgi:predicted DNA-binding protein
MLQDVTLHVKLDRETDVQLKSLAYQRGKSKGQLVREALTACYQTAADDLSVTQRNALAAYHGGYISIGRLARDMGMHVLEMRKWMNERGFQQRSAVKDTDTARPESWP